MVSVSKPNESTDESSLDDLEAVRAVVQALSKFPTADKQRILRWASEKLGLRTDAATVQADAAHHVEGGNFKIAGRPDAHSGQVGGSVDIKTFINSKNPNSDNQFAAAVAYFHRFEAAASARKESIDADDLQDACRKVGRSRMSRPSQTLVNSHAQGLLDKTGERGKYELSTVGENLVAVALPSTEGARATRPKSKKTSKQRKAVLKKPTAKKPATKKGAIKRGIAKRPSR
jgi:hypothetical protein